jgi:hypothetical protein
MTLDEVRPYQGVVCRITTKDPVYGGGATFEGRVEIVNDETIQIVGQPKLGGLSLVDAAPYGARIDTIVEITPLR